MKQIEYTEKQLMVLELLDDFAEVLKPNEFMFDSTKQSYFVRVQEIKKRYGIEEMFLTLREYLEKYGSEFDRFAFVINGIQIGYISGINDFEETYNPALLDKYYVLSDTAKGKNSEDYESHRHHLELAPKD